MHIHTILKLLSIECIAQSDSNHELQSHCVHTEDQERARLRSCLWMDAGQILDRAALRSLQTDPLKPSSSQSAEVPNASEE